VRPEPEAPGADPAPPPGEQDAPAAAVSVPEQPAAEPEAPAAEQRPVLEEALGRAPGPEAAPAGDTAEQASGAPETETETEPDSPDTAPKRRGWWSRALGGS
jgi:ribonuclease E